LVVSSLGLVGVAGLGRFVDDQKMNKKSRMIMLRVLPRQF
jgi:hypothetical protein